MLTILALGFFMGLPVIDFLLFRNHIRIQKTRNHKLRYYGQILLELWVPTLIVFGLALAGVFTLSDIGIRWFLLEEVILPLWLSTAILVVTLVILAYLVFDLVRMKFDAAYNEKVRTRISAIKVPAYVAYLTPKTAQEKRVYAVMGLSAGFTEEMLYRGFLLYVLVSAFPQIGIGVAIALTAFLFCMGHLYQGVSGMIRTFVLGLIWSLIYLATGTILLCIVFHILIDVSSSLLELGSPEAG